MAANIPTKGSFKKLSRFELIDFVNRTLQLENKLLHVEQLSTGAAYCQMMDKLFPNSVALQRVKLKTKRERESINNFKLLEASFKKMSVTKEIPIEKLVKGRLKDNLDFLQWFHWFFEANYKDNNSNAPTAPKGALKEPAPVGASMSRRASDPPKRPANYKANNSNAPTAPKSAPKPTETAGGDTLPSIPPGTVEALIDERDFFYSKLRDIEIICHHSADNGRVPEDIYKPVQDVLYHCREGFAPPKPSTSTEENNEKELKAN